MAHDFRTEAERLADSCSDFVNHSRTSHVEEFVARMANCHRTLQQAFTGVCVAWLKHLASLKENQYDLRNEAAVKFAKAVDEKVGLYGFPTI